MSRAAAATASVSRMLSEPVSAQEDGGCILIFMFGATGIGGEVERGYCLKLYFHKH